MPQVEVTHGLVRAKVHVGQGHERRGVGEARDGHVGFTVTTCLVGLAEQGKRRGSVPVPARRGRVLEEAIGATFDSEETRPPVEPVNLAAQAESPVVRAVRFVGVVGPSLLNADRRRGPGQFDTRGSATDRRARLRRRADDNAHGRGEHEENRAHCAATEQRKLANKGEMLVATNQRKATKTHAPRKASDI